MIYKVEIDTEGTITRNDEVIATISEFAGTDFVKFPNTLRPTKIRLKTGERVTITYGCMHDGKFEETCHIKCIWGKHCLQYMKNKCMYCNDFSDVGYYIIE